MLFLWNHFPSLVFWPRWTQATGTGPEADGPSVAFHDRMLQRQVRVAARAQEQPGRPQFVHQHAQVLVSGLFSSSYIDT